MKLNELLSNSDLALEFFSKSTPEEAQAFAKSKGVEVTIDELKALAASIRQAKGAELSSDELDVVAGGASAYEMYQREKTSNQELFDKVIDIITSW